MINDLQIMNDRLNEVEKKGKDLWVEINSNVHYTDIGAKHEEEILQELKSSCWREVVNKRYSKLSPWLYKIITDRGRSLFLDFLPIKMGGKFLDVGSGWGQIAIPLSKYGNVFCLDVTLPRLNILREIARQERAYLNYICGNYCTLPFGANQFDLVIFNGALEWISIGLPDNGILEAQNIAIRKTYSILNPEGIIYIGIENAMGLKYLLGAPDDHTAIQDFSFLNEQEAVALYNKVTGKGNLRAKTWSLNEYKTLLLENGFEIVQIYGCFPDYKIIRQMIPLEDVNSFILDNSLSYHEHSGADGVPLPFIDKMKPIYSLLAKNGVAELFCPSFCIVAKKRG